MKLLPLIFLITTSALAGSTRTLNADSIKSGDNSKTWTPPPATGTIPLATRTINAQTGTTYTLVASDGSDYGSSPVITLNNASTITLTVPPNSSVPFATGAQVDYCQIGAGKVTAAPGSGVTINSLSGNLSTNGQYVCVSLLKTATNTWILFGNLVP